MKLKNFVAIVLVAIMFGLLIFGFSLYRKTFISNTTFSQREVYVTIPTNSTYEDIKQILSPYIKDFESFDKVFQQVSYNQSYIQVVFC